ncbi:MAG: aminopeptidase [Thermoplasmata archaeon]
MPPGRSELPIEARVARSVLGRSLGVEKGERVLIETWSHTLPWAAAMARESRRLGARPLVIYEDENAYWQSVGAGEAKILGKPGKHEWAALSKSDVYIYFWGPADRARLAALPPETVDRLLAYNEAWYDLAAKAGVRGARMEVARPSPSLARLYGANENAWRREVADASLVDPKALARDAERVARAVEQGESLTLRHGNGTDLTLRLGGRAARRQCARVPDKGERANRYGSLINIPGGSVNVALDGRTADGTLVGNRAGYFDRGVTRDVTWTFAKGRLTSWSYGAGSDLFETPFRAAGKGADRPGTLTIGINPKVRNAPMVEDLARGAITLTVGGNSFLGGSNASPFSSWALIDGADVEVDGTPLLKAGELA